MNELHHEIVQNCASGSSSSELALHSTTGSRVDILNCGWGEVWWRLFTSLSLPFSTVQIHLRSVMSPYSAMMSAHAIISGKCEARTFLAGSSGDFALTVAFIPIL